MYTFFISDNNTHFCKNFLCGAKLRLSRLHSVFEFPMRYTFQNENQHKSRRAFFVVVVTPDGVADSRLKPKCPKICVGVAQNIYSTLRSLVKSNVSRGKLIC